MLQAQPLDLLVVGAEHVVAIAHWASVREAAAARPPVSCARTAYLFFLGFFCSFFMLVLLDMSDLLVRACGHGRTGLIIPAKRR
jgi:hypothetical protein